MAPTGLRELKKAETREAISMAAVRLTHELGLENVTGDAISEAAHVAPRTFRNYFANKEEAILYAVRTFVQHYVDLLCERDESEPIIDSLEAAAVALIDSPSQIDRVLTVREITHKNEALRVHWAATNVNLDLTALTAEIARRTGTDPRVDVYPRVATQAAWGVITAVLNMQPDGKHDRTKAVERVRLGFASLGNGLTKPFRR